MILWYTQFMKKWYLFSTFTDTIPRGFSLENPEFYKQKFHFRR